MPGFPALFPGLRPLLACAVIGALVACTGADEEGNPRRPSFEGIVFKARLSAEREDKRAFVITVSPASANPGAALEAGRYESVKYCLLSFGASAADWTVGPDTPVDQLRIVDDTITLSGRCTERA